MKIKAIVISPVGRALEMALFMNNKGIAFKMIAAPDVCDSGVYFFIAKTDRVQLLSILEGLKILSAIIVKGVYERGNRLLSVDFSDMPTSQTSVLWSNLFVKNAVRTMRQVQAQNPPSLFT